MKILFLFFLLVNAALFYLKSGWFHEAPQTVILKQPPLPAGVEKLTLLRERGLGLTAAPVVAAKKAVKPEATPLRGQAASQASAPQAESALSPPSPVSKSVKSTAMACFTLGPFVKAGDASQAAEAISALGVTVKRRQVSQRTPKGYWVYLPPFKSYAAARKQVQALQKQGLTDLFIMGKGNRQNAVSLGLFKSEGTATERFQQVKDLGLDAVMETQYRITKQAWLDISVAGNQTATIASLTAMAEDFPRTDLSQRKCQ
jgi:hypothetical protein